MESAIYSADSKVGLETLKPKQREAIAAFVLPTDEEPGISSSTN